MKIADAAEYTAGDEMRFEETRILKRLVDFPNNEANIEACIAA